MTYRLHQFTEANYPILDNSSGFEARILLRAWAEQLKLLTSSPGTNCAEIVNCAIRIGEIAQEAAIHSDPRNNAEET